MSVDLKIFDLNTFFGIFALIVASQNLEHQERQAWITIGHWIITGGQQEVELWIFLNLSVKISLNISNENTKLCRN